MRDHTKPVMACLSTSRTDLSHALVVEFHALGRAMELASELGCNSVQLEGDTQVLIKAIDGA